MIFPAASRCCRRTVSARNAASFISSKCHQRQVASDFARSRSARLESRAVDNDAANILWEAATAGRAGLDISVSRSKENYPKWRVAVSVTAPDQHVILKFAISGPDELRELLLFLERTHGREFEDRVQVDFGSFHGRPLRLVKNSTDRAGGTSSTTRSTE